MTMGKNRKQEFNGNKLPLPGKNSPRK